MKQPGNTWLEVWQLAYPLPVRCQKKLFDHTSEAEKVIVYYIIQISSWLQTGVALYGISETSRFVTTTTTITITNGSGQYQV